MTKLDRYISRHILTSMLMVLLIIVILDGIFSFIGQLSDLRAAYGASNALWYIVLHIPQSLYTYLPFAAIIGCLTGLGGLASTSELTVMRASGISLLRIVFSIFKPAFLLIIVGILLNEYVIPNTSQIADEYRTVHRLEAGRFSNEGIWLRQGNNFIYINAIDEKDKLHNIIRFKFNNHRQLLSASVAESGELKGNKWILKNAQTSHFKKDTVTTTKKTLAASQNSITKQTLKIITTPTDILSMQSLLTYSKYMQSQGLDARQYLLAFWNKALQPFAILALVMVGISFIFGPLRSGTMGFRVFCGVITGLTFMITERLAGPTSLVYGFSPALAVALPIFLFLLLGLFLLKRAA